jgi:AraC family transcriptional regulator
MKPRIENSGEKKLIGHQLTMSFINNRTLELWQDFMPRRKMITHCTGADLYSVEIYASGFFKNFNPNATFRKWAAVAVTDFHSIPEGMETLVIPAGQYAVFLYKGPASKGSEFYQNIFTVWLPQSGYRLDNRPHFALMGEKYKHEDPDSEEEIWIPVRLVE